MPHSRLSHTSPLRLGSLALLALFFSSRAPAATLLVDFEHYPGPDGRLGTADDVPTEACGGPFGPVAALGGQFSAVGLTFSQGTLHCGSSFWPGHEHFISSSPPDATLTIPVNAISITSYSYWTATLTAYDAADNVLATNVLVHPAEGTAPFLGTLTVSTAGPIARFTVRAATPSLILNLDDLELTLKRLRLFTVAPCRLVDTREPNGPLSGPALQGGAPRTFSLGGACSLPATAWAVAVNVTATAPSVGGDLRLAPGDRTTIAASVLNFAGGQTRANLAVLPVGRGGTLSVLSSQPGGNVHVILDLTGYFE